MIKNDLYNAIKGVVGDKKFTLLTPRNANHGDFAVHKKSLGGNISADQFSSDLFSKVVEIDDFINFTINPRVSIGEVFKILEQKQEYGLLQQDKPLKITLEFGQPNTHKLPHIGHLFSYIYGESLARLLESQGNEVRRANYQGDVGLHVAKCLFQISNSKIQIQKLETLEEKVEFLQKCYQEGSRAYEEDPAAKKAIDELNKKIYQKDPSLVDLWNKTRAWSLEYYQEFEKKLGIAFDNYYFESQTGPVGKKLVEENIDKIFEKSDNAIIFRGEKYGLHTRVFINSYGNPTYEAKDVGLAKQKYEDWQFDRAIVTTANEQNEYWQVVKQAIELTLPYLQNKINQIGFGMVQLKEGKMSSRTGNVVSAFDLVSLVEREVAKLTSEKENVAPVSLAAIKYSFLKSEARKNIAFDLEESIATTGNSGPYLLYTYARCRSVIARSEATKQSHEIAALSSQDEIARNDYEPEELSLLRTFFKFPSVVEDAARNFAPHIIATYVFDLAQKFNLFYEKLPILKAESDDKVRRLALTKATAQIVKNSLHLLGIETLERI